MNRFAQFLLAVTVIAGLLFAFVVVRTGLRLYALNKVLSVPAARQRLSVMPKSKSLGASTLTNSINLGYATFSARSSGPTTVQSSGSTGTMLLVSNGQFQLVFLPPFASKLTGGSSSVVNAYRYPRLASHLQKWQVDPVAAEVETEETRELPILKVAAMNQEEFLLYSIMLADKACCRRGRNEVYSFTAPHTKGIVRIGDSAQDRRIASASIVSQDRSENVGFHLYLRNDGSTHIGQILDDILSSFHFTTDIVGNHDEITNLISSAGIRRRDENLSDAPGDGSQPVH